MQDRCFAFWFTRPYLIAGYAFGVRPSTCCVRLAAKRLAIEFGPWKAETALENILGVTLTGPFQFLKTAGPPHLSLSDRGITFATNGNRAVCLALRSPVPGIEPTGRLRHPGITVTVADPDGLAEALAPMPR
jgi:hypothetical protein